ncbi:MAG: hypothetical protein QM771_03160 [Nitrospira sp.]
MAEAIQALSLRHAITLVNRDELQDGGASVFAETIRHIRRLIPSCTIEVLIPTLKAMRRHWRRLRLNDRTSVPQYRDGAQTAVSVDPATREISAIDRVAGPSQQMGMTATSRD